MALTTAPGEWLSKSTSPTILIVTAIDEDDAIIVFKE